MGSTEQTKTGNLIIEGVLRLGQFATAPSGTEGALYYDTTEKKTKLYSNSAWADLGGGWDGILPNYTTEQRNALSLADGLIVYNTTDKTVQIYKSGAWANVGTKLSLAAVCSLDGDCDSTHCVDGVCCATTCDGNCNRCNVASSMGICTDVASDCTGNCDICSSGNCASDVTLCTGNCDVCSGSGTAYSCAASDALCTTCYQCTGSGTAYSCSAVAAGTAGYGCTATHYRCNGAGACTAPTQNSACISSYYSCGTAQSNCNTACARCYGEMLVDCIAMYVSYAACDADAIWNNCTVITNGICKCTIYTY